MSTFLARIKSTLAALASGDTQSEAHIDDYGALWVRLAGASGAAQLPAVLGRLAAGSSLSVALSTEDAAKVPALVAGAVPTKVAARVARAAFMASAALPAAGAYTTTTAYAIPDGVQRVTFYCTYTRGAAGGFPKFRCDVGNGNETASVVTVDPSIAVTQPKGLQLAYISEINGPEPQDASAVVFALTYSVAAGETTIALQAAELGITATPGTLAIALTAGY